MKRKSPVDSIASRSLQFLPDGGTSGAAEKAPDAISTGLLDATRAIFVVEGAKALTVRRIADAAGCTTMAVYSRFGGKDGLLGALFDEGFDRLRAAQLAVDTALLPEAYLIALCVAYRETAQRYPAHYALMLGHDRGELHAAPESAARAHRAFEFLVCAVERWLSAQPGTSAAPDRATRIAIRLFALCHGWVSLVSIGYAPVTAQANGDFVEALHAQLSNIPQ